MKKLTRFRIKNYKSIVDSGWCHLDDKITILAGKNEAGKTAVLEALEDLNVDKNIRDEAKPIWDSNARPEIEIEIELNENEKKELEEALGSALAESKIHIIKIFPNKFRIDTLDENTQIQKEKEEIIKEAESLITLYSHKYPNFTINFEWRNNPQILSNYLSRYRIHPNFNLGAEEPKKDIEKLMQLAQRLGSIYAHNDKLFELVKKYVPNFILFKSFEDILPEHIPITQALNNPIVSDLAKVSDFDINKISPQVIPREKCQECEKINTNFNEDYKEFWTQDDANLYVNVDSEKINFLFKEGGRYFTPQMRSLGKQWHFAFYVRVTARSVAEKNNIILIDEPGLFLHATAQKDILKKLEEVSSRSQIIYTTHSPYLIPSDKLWRVRLVVKEKEDRGTTIKKVTAQADKDTLSPILTAIGEDLSVGIKIDKKNSIVVEGYSDYLWLSAWKDLLQINEELNFIPAVGASNTVHIGSILLGWGIDPIFVLDNDDQGNNAKSKLIDKLCVERDRILQVPFDKKGEIEDLYSDTEKEKIQNLLENKNNQSKTLVAFQFLSLVKNGKISADEFPIAKENFNKLFKDLIALVNKQNTAAESCS